MEKKLPTVAVSRRQFLNFLGSLALIQTVPGCALRDLPVTIAAQVWPGYEPLYLARDRAWLDANKITLLETVSATESLQALMQGKTDGAALTMDEVLKARAEGLSISVVMIFDISAGADMLIAYPDISNLSELKGKRIGYEQGAVGELVLTEVLQAAGLTKQDVSLTILSIEKHYQAWLNNEIDAVATYEPIASQLLSQNGVKLFDSRQIPNTIVDVLAIRNDILDLSHANAIRHLVATHFYTLDYLNRNPHDAAYRMAAHLGLPASNVLTTLKGLVLPDAANNYRWLDGTRPELLNCARKLSNIMVDNGSLKAPDTLVSLINADFLPTEFFY